MTSNRIARVLLALVLTAAMSAAVAADMRAFDADSMQAIRTAHGGRPFILAFWSVHCAPCLGDMADWRALRRRHPGVPILLVATDPPSEHARAAQVLASHPPGSVETWAFADDFAERIRFSVDPTWRGELPRTYFYDGVHAAEVVSGRLDRRWAEAWFARLR